MVLHVCVIGGGAAGLVALRHLMVTPDKFQAVAFEFSSSIGGTWVYTEASKDDKGQLAHSCMYKNRVTNLPKDVMLFPDFPFRASLPSFIKHTDVLDYLRSYASHFHLNQAIQLSTRVDEVKPSSSRPGTWEVTVTKLSAPDAPVTEVQSFDAVMVCNGHYSMPLVPKISGMDGFSGPVVHSHSYRHPDDFTGHKVVVIGAGPSGLDIMLDIAPHAEQVYFCHWRQGFNFILPENVSQHPPIDSVQSDGVTLTDGQRLSATAILMCTGYHYTFPFLSPECRPIVTEERLTPLYKHLIHREHPTLSFIGIPKMVSPFPMFDSQVRFVLAALTGEMVLPSLEEMAACEEADFRRRMDMGIPARYAHSMMGDLQWKYLDDLASLAAFPPIPKVVEKLYEHTLKSIFKNPSTFKQKNYRIVDNEEFEEVQANTTSL